MESPPRCSTPPRHRPHRPSPLKVSVVAKPVVVDDSFEGEYLKALHWTPTELQRSRKEAMLEAEAAGFSFNRDHHAHWTYVRLTYMDRATVLNTERNRFQSLSHVSSSLRVRSRAGLLSTSSIKNNTQRMELPHGRLSPLRAPPASSPYPLQSPASQSSMAASPCRPSPLARPSMSSPCSDARPSPSPLNSPLAPLGRGIQFSSRASPTGNYGKGPAHAPNATLATARPRPRGPLQTPDMLTDGDAAERQRDKDSFPDTRKAASADIHARLEQCRPFGTLRARLRVLAPADPPISDVQGDCQDSSTVPSAFRAPPSHNVGLQSPQAHKSLLRTWSLPETPASSVTLGAQTADVSPGASHAATSSHQSISAWLAASGGVSSRPTPKPQSSAAPYSAAPMTFPPPLPKVGSADSGIGEDETLSPPMSPTPPCATHRQRPRCVYFDPQLIGSELRLMLEQLLRGGFGPLQREHLNKRIEDLQHELEAAMVKHRERPTQAESQHGVTKRGGASEETMAQCLNTHKQTAQSAQEDTIGGDAQLRPMALKRQGLVPYRLRSQPSDSDDDDIDAPDSALGQSWQELAFHLENEDEYACLDRSCDIIQTHHVA